MPTYTFRCPQCKKELTGIFPMKDFDGKKVVCPECGRKGLKQIFKSPFSIINKKPACPTGNCPLVRK
ncbi:MAG: hypothetical protein JW991_01690 [Candidatus Pacebacteria bacterium]|nr:hypothetical protein [Candidatus Paceibacterota bacterium]